MRAEPARAIANSRVDEYQELTSKGFLPLSGALVVLNSATTNSYPADDGNSEVEQPEDRGQDPDVEDAKEREDQAPDEGSRDGQDGSEEAVEPELGAGEQDEGELPHPVEALRRRRLGQHVVKVELKTKQKVIE